MLNSIRGCLPFVVLGILLSACQSSKETGMSMAAKLPVQAEITFSQ